MINISDIRKKLQAKPEPVEIKNLREKIKSSFSALSFIEEGHIYTVSGTNLGNRKLPSVSETVRRFEPEADWDSIKSKYAKKNDMTVDAVDRMWGESNIKSTNNGTLTHLFGENYMAFCMGSEDFHPRIAQQYEKGYLIPYCGKETAICSFYDDLLAIDGMWPVMSEARMYMGVDETPYPNCEPYAGTMDMLFAYIDSGGVVKPILCDWKTNKCLISDYNRTFGVTLKHPFNDMTNEPLSVYTLQLSLYQLCLMQIGIKVWDRKIVWLKDDGEYQKIPTLDVTERILKALDSRK